MNKFKSDCISKITDKILVLEENKRKCVFSNPDQHMLTKVIVDGCQITEGVKCDFLILDHQENEYFIELKGKDIPHAIEQLEAAIKQLSSTNDIQKKAIIVASRYPSNDTSLQLAKATFKKKYNINLIAKNRIMEILIK